MTLAKGPFWLDGGYDSDAVAACPYHPDHRWWVFQLGEVIDCERSGHNPDEWMVICRGCYVPRCGHVGWRARDGSPFHFEDDPCTEPRHHDGPHRHPSGLAYAVGEERPR